MSARETSVVIREITAPGDVDAFRGLLLEYAASRPGGFSPRMAEDLAALPGRYRQPTGALYLAEDTNTAIGTAAWTEHSPGLAEIKRVYVTPAARGKGLALQLSRTVINAVRARGYTQLALSTWLDNTSAIALYRKLGFAEIAPFKTSPIPNLVYMGLALGAGTQGS